MRCNNFNIKVFVEDTDFQGYVYHANYLKYFERARSQFLNDYDISQVDEQTKGLFVIKDLFIKYSSASKSNKIKIDKDHQYLIIQLKIF